MDDWGYRNKGLGIYTMSEEAKKAMVKWGKELGLEIGSEYGELGWYIRFC